MSETTTDLVALVENTVTGMGYEFVDFERLARGLVRVTIDREGGVGVDDCEQVSNQLSYLFTVEDVPYERLEVSSPGVERPLKRLSDWQRFVGKLTHVELFTPLCAEGFPEAGRRKLDGRIQGVRAARERIAQKRGKKVAAVEPVAVSFTLDQVDRAHLVAELNFKGN